jgi:hypothetical protein
MMVKSKGYGSNWLVKETRLVLLLWTSFVLVGCAYSGQPHYQPLSRSSAWSGQIQGYASYQIDERTYLVAYQNYFSSVPVEGKWADPFDGKWVKGAQEYVLYRAGELAKSKGRNTSLSCIKMIGFKQSFPRVSILLLLTFLLVPA